MKFSGRSGSALPLRALRPTAESPAPFRSNTPHLVFDIVFELDYVSKRPRHRLAESTTLRQGRRDIAALRRSP
jgi:hypothetical protein